ncbi:MAG: lamin tail domain-containing protein [Gammaproteobacteria bacterium]
MSVSDGEFTDFEDIQITVTAAPPPPTGPYSLAYSLTSDRAGQLVLNGAIVEGNLYGRVLPETSDIDRIQFYLDGSNSSFKSESLAPYELNGGGSQARAYDTTDLSDGVHIIRTDVRLDNGDIISFDTQFTVANDAPPVNTAPTLNAIGNQSVQAGSSASINISSSDAENDTRTFSTTGLPSYANFTDNGNGTATLSINPQAANVGTANLRVSVSDGEFSDFEDIQINVTAAPPPTGDSLEITEFLASNKGTFVDGEDWIEIHNNGSTAVDLTGWCLTDDASDLSLWCFTSGNLASDSYLVVIADNPTVPQDLHAGLKLGKGGEYLALVKPDGSIATEFAPEFRQQYDDISYGFDANGDQKYFSTPTPGLPNGSGVAGFLSFNPDQLTLAVSSGTAMTQSVLTTLSEATEAYTLAVNDGDDGWLSASADVADDGVTPDNIGITADASGLTDGTYNGTITASAPDYADSVLNITFTVTDGGVQTGSLELTEFMASNTSTFEAGADWIEIHNNGSTEVDLSGWCLTDDATDLSQWCFTSGTLAVDDYLVVVADNPAIAQELHASFKLGAGGEYLALIKPDGSIATEYAPEYPAQTPDVSYGLNTNGDLRFFTTPTPGEANNEGVATLGSVLSLSHQRGFYDSAIQVSITSDTSVDSVRYTLDGSEPTESTGQVYSGTAINVDSTTILRVAAIASGVVMEKVTTHSYIFLDDVLDQADMDQGVVTDYNDQIISAMQAIPTMSVAADEVYGSNGFYDNADTEKKVSVEIIYPDVPENSHQANAGIETHSHSDRPKHSLRLNFRAVYGDAKFSSDLIENSPQNGDTADGKYDKIILRGGNNRCWCRGFNPDKTTYTIDQFYRDSQIAATGYGVRGTFVHLYLNGEYHGLYNAVERADKHFLSDYYGGTDEDWFSTNHGIVHDGSDPLNGDRTRYDYLTTTLVTKDMSVAANYAELQEYLDIDHFIDYLLVTWWAGTGDWPDNNWYAGSRNPSSPEGSTGLKFFAWDGEWSWDAPVDFSNPGNRAKIHPIFESDESVGNSNLGTPSPSNRYMIAQIWHAARQNSSFMDRVEVRANALLGTGGALSDSVAQDRWTALNDYVYEAVIGESARWGDEAGSTRTRDDDWQNQADKIFDLIDGNANVLLNQLRSEGYIP